MYLLGLDKCVIFNRKENNLDIIPFFRNALQSVGMVPKTSVPDKDGKPQEKTEVRRLSDSSILPCILNNRLTDRRTCGENIRKYVSMPPEESELGAGPTDCRQGKTTFTTFYD